MSHLAVRWEGVEVGRLRPSAERPREYSFDYVDRSRPVSLSLPTGHNTPFSASESRPFFEGLLPEGALREQIAAQLGLAAGDSYGLLSALGRDCAGALQVLPAAQSAGRPAGVRWLSAGELDHLIEELPRRPLGMSAGEPRLRLSLAGVQRKAVLFGDGAGRFGEPLDGMASTHILKPANDEGGFPELPANERFCMELAARCGLATAAVRLIEAAGRDCLVVERFDRDTSVDPPRRLHQEDACQALGLTPDFKYQRPDWRLPSYAALAELLDAHSLQPGLDRLALARTAVFNFLIANADGHARNLSLLHLPGGVRLAPLYDLVCTAAYPDLSPELALAIGDELDPEAIGLAHWLDLAHDLGLRPNAFARLRERLGSAVPAAARELALRASSQGWHRPVLDAILATIDARAQRLAR